MMTGTELLPVLLETTVASSAAIVLVLLLRGPVRSWLGASAAYLLWLVLPSALLAVLLPGPSVTAVPMRAPGATVQLGEVAVAGSGVVAAWPQWLLCAWLAGAVLMAWQLVRQQRRFLRELGALEQRSDGLWQAQSSTGLPAVVGLLWPKIVLPTGFEQRYSVREQQLVLLHERVHLRRGDIAINAALALLQCMYWFNPLLRLAQRHCREDQELSCDERVIAHTGGARRSYGEAMLKTGLAQSALPVGCHWQNHHPLKERIAMLKRPVPGKKQWVAMLALSVVLSSITGYAAWAAQPAREVASSESASVVISSKNQAPPAYPEAAFEQGIAGKVVLQIEVGADGRANAVTVVESTPQGVFDEVSIAAARKWSFTPAQEGGKAVAGKVRVPIWFDLDEDAHHDQARGGN